MALKTKGEAAPPVTPATTAPAQPAAGGVRRELPPVTRRRRPGLIALGTVLVVVLFLGFMAALNSSGESTQVLAVAARVDRGEQIAPEDLTTVEVPEDTTLTALNADQFESVVGQYATVDLLPGATLTTDSLAAEITPAPGSSVVGLALTPGQMPSQALRAGDQVRLVDTPPSQGDPPPSSPSTIAATVLSATPTADSSGTIIVDLLVEDDIAPDLAARAATGRVVLVIDTVQGG